MHLQLTQVYRLQILKKRIYRPNIRDLYCFTHLYTMFKTHPLWDLPHQWEGRSAYKGSEKIWYHWDQSVIGIFVFLKLMIRACRGANLSNERERERNGERLTQCTGVKRHPSWGYVTGNISNIPKSHNIKSISSLGEVDTVEMNATVQACLASLMFTLLRFSTSHCHLMHPFHLMSLQLSLHLKKGEG